MAGFEITVYQRCTNDYKFTPLDVDGNTISIEAGDVVRFKLGRGDGAPVLDLLSGQETSNKSTVILESTDPAVAVVRLAQNDMNIPVGIYRGFLGIVDDSEVAPVDAFKPVSQGVVYVVSTPGGFVGKTNS